MRFASTLSLALIVTAFAAAVARAQPKEIKERLAIERVRVGLPEGRKSDHGKYKTGFWAPVYVDLSVGPQDIPAGEAVLAVETPDSDGILNQYTQPLPALPRRQSVAGIITYVRPGNFSSEINVSVQINKQQVAKARATPDSDIVDNGGVLWLALGSKLPGLQRALTVRQNQQFPQGPGEPQPIQPGGQADDLGDDDLADTSLRRFAAIDTLEQMPTRWFGYQAVDVMVLTSGSESFLTNLAADRSGRLDALTEWVRRGGRLIISTGHNQQIVDKLLKNMQLMHCTLEGTVTRAPLTGFQQVISFAAGSQFPRQGRVEVAKIVPGIGVDLLDERLVDTTNAPKEMLPLAVQAGCGLGHVVLVGVDLDGPPFTAWKGQGDFWRFLQSKLEPKLGVSEGRQVGFRMNEADNTELAAQLQNSLEKFGDITVISFGWVALFILIYIVIVGPLDYLFLKKVVKRLELTWITFPAVVVAVSTAAYFTAYYLKGNDLKINKLDVVDIDLTPAVDPKEPPPRIYGSTWFTLFSPRIQNYTIGLEPADGWGGGNTGASTLVGWMARPMNVFGGTGRAGSQSLFRRTYDYAPDAAGVEGVPIQVWATKSFTASWVVRPTSDEAPFSADLKYAQAASQAIIGTVTNNLPVDLIDVSVIYKGTVYPQTGSLEAGMPKRLDFTGNRRGLVDWMREGFPDAPRLSTSVDSLAAWSTSSLMKGLLFHDKAESGLVRNNTGLRTLDQGWRLKDRDEVVLLGRVEPRGGGGPAEKVTLDPGTPSRLWLGALPGSGARPKLDGSLTQRTFVRVYIPVQK